MGTGAKWAAKGAYDYTKYEIKNKAEKGKEWIEGGKN